MNRSTYCVASALISAAVGMPVVGHAQSDGLVIEEVLVTARRRAESIQDVPGSVTAITQSTIDIRACIQGDNWAVIGFARNITDEKYLEEVIPAPEFGGTFDHPGARRRYGVEVSYRF
ncbi:MAG: hypothetical protein VB949_00505 [Pseudomonadales bacterium]